MRKKLLSLLFLIILLPLSASSLRVGLYVRGSDGLKTIASDALSLVVPSVISSSALMSANKERSAFEAEIDYEKSVHQAYASDGDIPERSERVYEEAKEYEIITPEIREDVLPFLSSRDEAALEHIRVENKLDALVVILSADYGSLLDYDSFIYLPGEVHDTRKAMVMSSQIEEEFLPLSLSFGRILDDSLGFLDFSDYPLSARFYVDGSIHSPVNGVIAAQEGSHVVSVLAEGYTRFDQEVSLLPSASLSISAASMERIVLPAIAFTSIPSDAKLSFSGQDPVSLPVLKEGLNSPLVLTAEKDGFLPLSLQVTEAEGVYGMQLKPEWMGSENRLEEAKKDFYASLRNTFLSIGAAAASQALTSIYADELGDFKTGLNVITTGVSVVSVISLIKNLADYYNIAKQTYLEDI